MSRIVRVVNWVLVLGLVAALGGVWWWVWRPTPKTSGTVQAPVAKAVEVTRDERGVPHITAQSAEDVLFAQGYVTAQDRMWQMDSLRRVAAGELSEIFGKATLELDIKARKLRMRRIAELWLKNIPPAQRALLAAYARGVNHYIDTNRGRWAPEFAALGYEPRQWNMVDTLLCALQMHRTLSGHWEQDLLKRRMLAAGDKTKVEALFPVRTGMEPKPGSNAWALSGKRTTNGKALLANDPHLEWAMPAVWYMIHLRAPGLNVEGASLPGVPAVVIGHNERIAWGITALQTDNMDLYVENIDPRTGRYEFKGQTMQAQQEVDLVPVKGDKPAQVMSWLTVHGPIFTADGSAHMALKWAVASPGDAEFPVLDLNRANNWEEFRAALKRMPSPNMNVIYADVEGNIGHQVAGRLPVRKGFPGDVPVDGSSGKFEWEGFVPFEQLPSYYNPESGMVVTANQNPFPENTPYTVSGFFASHHRAKQIADRLQSKSKWSADEMMSIQRDVYSGFLRLVAEQAVAAVDRRKEKNPLAQEGARLLRGWNGQVEKELAAPMLATLLYQHLQRTMADKAAPKEGVNYKSFMAPGVVEWFVRTRPKGWFDDYDMMLSDTLADAVEEGKRMAGRNLGKWKYGSINSVKIEHPVWGRIGFIAPYFNAGPAPMSGSSTTVRQTTQRLGPSMRYVAVPGDWDASVMTLTTGQSGHIFSGHYKDQWEAYYVGRSFPLEFSKVKAASTLTLRP